MLDLFSDEPDGAGVAMFSDDRKYRYLLQRGWNMAEGPAIVWCGLNPSTADEKYDDPTTRRIRTFSSAWGFNRYALINAFALRSTDPSALYAARDPIGPKWDSIVESVLNWQEDQTVFIAAWGAHGRIRDRDIFMRDLLREFKIQPLCLGITKGGQPKHPLYIKGDTTPQPYEFRELT